MISRTPSSGAAIGRTRTLVLAGIAGLLAACGAVPEGSQHGAPQSAPRPAAVSREAQICLAGLGESGSRFSPLPDRYYGAGCSTVGAVQLSAVRGDRAELGLANLGPVECPTAAAFAGWARYGVDRAARQMLGSPLMRIETMGSYSCRDVAGTGRRSAHARGAAIDVAAFVLADGRRIAVAQHWAGGSEAEREFLRVIHQSACKRFATVLGPDYNAAHRDHFHLELAAEGSGAAFCR
ncbi:MAG: extensin [Erythrobacter sp.]|nr:extensin [Erythrobacter sp.]